jgi:hypothetical protein
MLLLAIAPTPVPLSDTLPPDTPTLSEAATATASMAPVDDASAMKSPPLSMTDPPSTTARVVLVMSLRASLISTLRLPDAPLPLSHERHSHAEHCWDFYKPEMHSEYPAVDGHLSNTIYLRSVDVCYNNFLRKTTPDGSVKTFDYMCFHSPYNKLVVKSVGRLLYNDYVRNPTGVDAPLAKALAQWHPDSIAPNTTYSDRGLDAALKKISAEVYASKCAPSAALSKEIGNSYTGALWMNLVSLVHNIVRADRAAAPPP